MARRDLWTPPPDVDGGALDVRGQCCVVVLPSSGVRRPSTRRLGLAEQLGDLGLDLLVEAQAQTVVVLGQLLDRLRARAGDGRQPVVGRVVLGSVVLVASRSSTSSEVVSSSSVNSIPRRSTAPVRSSGSAAAIAVSHSAASVLLALGLAAGRRTPTRAAAATGRRPRASRVGAAAERALEDQPRGGVLAEVQAGAGLDDAELDGLLRRRDSRRGPRPPAAARRRAGPCARSQSASTAR